MSMGRSSQDAIRRVLTLVDRHERTTMRRTPSFMIASPQKYFRWSPKR